MDNRDQWHWIIYQITRIGLVCVFSVNGGAILLRSSAQAEVNIPTYPQFLESSLPRPAVIPAKKKRIIFNLPDRSVPGSRVPGGTRSICLSNTPQFPLTAISPLTKDGLMNAEVKTFSSPPTFFVYLPQAPVAEAEFSLLDNTTSRKVLYQKTLKLTKTGGFVQVSVPENDRVNLEVNHSYLWTFSFFCDPEEPSTILSVGGGVRRVEVPTGFRQQIKTAQPEDLSRLYAEQGFWFEALDVLAQQRLARPQDKGLLQDWTDLLTAVKLKILANEPLLPQGAIK